jgi:acyl-CoA synthetase (AMP-forming)/AMP-acid ligase II
LIDEHGRRLTNADLRDRSEAVAGALVEHGAEPGDTVCWQLPTGLEAVVLMTACTRLGLRQVPLMPVLREAELAVVVAQTKPRLFISPATWRGFDHGALTEQLCAASGAESIVVDIEGIDASSFALACSAEVELPAFVSPSCPTWVFYTSGTTGTPKGALHTDGSVVASSGAFLAILGVNADDVLSIVYPVAHIGGPALLAAALRTGGPCILAAHFDPVETPLLLAREGVTELGSAAPFFLAYLAAQERHGPRRLFPHARLFANGGAPLPGVIADRLRAEMGGGSVVNGYGMTECPIVTFTSPEDPRVGDPDIVGQPAPGVSIRIVGADGRELGVGQEGEIRLLGPQLFDGYVDASLDAAALDEQGFLRTGDLGMLEPDGELRVTGRLKDVIIRNAENISAAEVEAVLESHPMVAEAAVVGILDDRTGERACAVVVLEGHGQLGLEDLVAWCRSRGLAAYKCPEQALIVDALPRNAMGKVRKDQLRELAASGDPN